MFLSNLQEDPPAGVSGAPTEDNILVWEAIIFGPQDTPFEDGTFKLTLEFTEEYPNKPPTVKFVSKMFHPNVYADGSICLDILQVGFKTKLATDSSIENLFSYIVLNFVKDIHVCYAKE